MPKGAGKSCYSFLAHAAGHMPADSCSLCFPDLTASPVCFEVAKDVVLVFLCFLSTQKHSPAIAI